MLCPQLSLRACMPYLAIPLLVGCSGRGAGSAQSARAMPDEQRSAYIASVQAEARTDAAHRVHPRFWLRKTPSRSWPRGWIEPVCA